MKYYAGIGSRETPDDILRLMTKGIARGLEIKRYTLRSGGARGADMAFERGVSSGINTEIFLPYDNISKWTNVFTDLFHPNPKALSDYARRLMNRNAMQILGKDGDTPVEFVVCWTKDGKASGGTGQAIRIAEYFKIPVFNLKNEDALEKLKEFINGS